MVMMMFPNSPVMNMMISSTDRIASTVVFIMADGMMQDASPDRMLIMIISGQISAYRAEPLFADFLIMITDAMMIAVSCGMPV